MTSRRYRALPTLRETIRVQGRMAAWVAEQVGLSRPTMSFVMQGRRTLSEEEAELISSRLGVPLFLLFEYSGESIWVSDVAPDAIAMEQAA